MPHLGRIEAAWRSHRFVPHRYAEDSPLRHYKLPRGEETAKVPVEPDAPRELLRRAAASPGGGPPTADD